ncbi:MAG: CoA transferase, partial [Deltaproteobacteria bacterium]|nr:CoA transferase [Deltaproteobacteria bacterium]
SGRSLGEWEEVLDWREVPYAPVHSMEEAVNDPHVVARNLIQEIGTDESGHTDDVLKELNYSDDEIIDLREKGSV